MLVEEKCIGKNSLLVYYLSLSLFRGHAEMFRGCGALFVCITLFVSVVLPCDHDEHLVGDVLCREEVFLYNLPCLWVVVPWL